MGFYVVPASVRGFNNFRYTHLRSGKDGEMRGDNTDVYGKSMIMNFFMSTVLIQYLT
jgi:hypothetical protein